MKILAKQIDEQTKQLNGIFSGTDYSWANENGFIEYEAEQAYDGYWYVQGYAPVKPAPTKEEINERKAEIREKLIDRYTLRRLRKMANHTWTEEDEQEYLNLDVYVTGLIEEEFGMKQR